MISFLKELWSYLQLVWKSKFKYMLLLFALWLYRIDFMPDTGGGMAKVVQIVALVGLLYMMKKYRNGILDYSFAHTNTATKSCLWLYVYGVISTLWAFMPSMAFFIACQSCPATHSCPVSRPFAGSSSGNTIPIPSVR